MDEKIVAIIVIGVLGITALIVNGDTSILAVAIAAIAGLAGWIAKGTPPSQ